MYRVTEVVGVSPESWDAAARNAVETAGGTIRDLRIAEVLRQDLTSRTEGSPHTAYGWPSPSSTRPATDATGG